MDLGDLLQPFDFALLGDGERDHFFLEHRPIDPTSVTVYKDSVPVVLVNEGVTLDYRAGMLVFDTPPPVGEMWEIEGKKWRYFSDEDMKIFIDTAMAQHSHHRGDDSGSQWTDSDIEPVEEYPIAILSLIQALWALATDAAFDIDILAPDGVNIPRSERYRQLLEMIGSRQAQYDEITAALNIGVKRLETMTVRRIAKNTNRLIPVYLPQEYDDYSKPKRVLFPMSLQGTKPIKVSSGSYNVDITSGDPVSFLLDFEYDITNMEFENAIRRGAFSGYMSTVGPAIREFTQEIVDGPNGILRLSLTGEESRILPYNSYWELQGRNPGEEFRTKMRGLVRATNNEVVR